MRRWTQRDEKLTAIRPGATIGHTQCTFFGMLKRGMKLVFELPTWVDGRAAAACASWL